MTGGEGTALYAFGLGLVGALNPCGFPLLPAYTSFFVADSEGGATRRAARALGGAGYSTLGFVAVFGIAGVVVKSGVGLVTGWVPWVMIPFGLALSTAGVAGLIGRPLLLSVVPVRTRRSPYRAVMMTSFGISYAVASLSCALPIFLAGIAGAFTRSGVVSGVADFVAYAVGMGLLMAVVALIVATAGTGALRRLRSLSRLAPRLGGGLLALVGAYLVYYWCYALADPLATPLFVRWVERVQAALAEGMSSSVRWTGAILGAAVLAAMIATAFFDRRASPDDPTPAALDGARGAARPAAQPAR